MGGCGWGDENGRCFESGVCEVGGGIGVEEWLVWKMGPLGYVVWEWEIRFVWGRLKCSCLVWWAGDLDGDWVNDE